MKNKIIKSLYVHIPFCQDICAYCDFPKVIYFEEMANKYLFHLAKEIENLHIPLDSLETIYVGGGTPSVLNNKQLLFLLELLYPYTKNVKEYTFEANPESLDEDKLKLMKKYGVNRLSIGVESTNDEILKAINRHHTFLDVKTVTSLAKNIGINNISFDLILGLPNVTKNMLKKDLGNLLSLNPTHISCYSLTVNPHTLFDLNHIKEKRDDEIRELYDQVEDVLLKHGYLHYEISNYAKPSYESKHNMTYWKDEPYYGVGLGAASYIGEYRYINTKSLTEYNSGITIKEKEYISQKDDITYFIMLNLRTTRGIIFEEFFQRFHIDFYQQYEEKINQLSKLHYLIVDDKHIHATYEGMMLLDQIILSFIEE